MRRLLIPLALALAAALCSAEPVARMPGEDTQTFAMRFAPPKIESLVKSIESDLWGLGAPVVAAFYKRSVVYADKRHNYGSNPDEYEVLGVLFMPLANGRYESVEIDSYGPEGSTAEIGDVHLDRAQNKSNPILVVHVHWQPRPGELHSVCAYAKPPPGTHPKRLARVTGYDCRY